MQLATSIQHLDYVMKLPPEMKKYRDDNILPQYILSKQNYNVDDEWGIGLWAWVNGIFVNTDMLKEAGLPIGLKYFEDIIPYAKKMTKYDGTGEITRAGISLRLSGQGSGVAQKWAMIGVFNAMHHVIVQQPDGKWREDYNNDAGRNTLQYYIDCLYKHKVNSYKIKQDTEAFGLELAAMYQRDNPVIGYMKKNAPKVNYDILQMPMLKGVEKKVMLTAVQSFYVTKISKYPQAAWAFVKYFQQPKWQEMIGIETGYEPVNKKTDRDKLYKLEPRLKSFDTSVYDKVFFEPAIPVWDEIQTKLAQRLVDAFRRQDLLDNPQGISKVISDAAEETTTILKESGFY